MSGGNERQDGGLSEIMLNNHDPPGQSQRKQSRKRTAKDSENDARILRHLSRLSNWDQEESDEIDPEDCQICGEVLDVYNIPDRWGNPSLGLQCRNCDGIMFVDDDE